MTERSSAPGAARRGLSTKKPVRLKEKRKKKQTETRKKKKKEDETCLRLTFLGLSRPQPASCQQTLRIAFSCGTPLHPLFGYLKSAFTFTRSFAPRLRLRTPAAAGGAFSLPRCERERERGERDERRDEWGETKRKNRETREGRERGREEEEWERSPKSFPKNPTTQPVGVFSASRAHTTRARGAFF